MTIKVYTDGATSGNPGISGWGYVALIDGKEYKRNCGYRLSTNNRMEMLSVIHAIKDLYEYGFLEKNGTLEVYSDSAYTILAFESVEKWKAKKYKDKKNLDLLEAILFIKKNFNIIFHKVEGHSGDKYNEMADDLAVKARELPDRLLKEDENYEGN